MSVVGLILAATTLRIKVKAESCHFSLTSLDPCSGRKFSAIWHGTSACHGVFIPDIQYNNNNRRTIAEGEACKLLELTTDINSYTRAGVLARVPHRQLERLHTRKHTGTHDTHTCVHTPAAALMPSAFFRLACSTSPASASCFLFKSVQHT